MNPRKFEAIVVDDEPAAISTHENALLAYPELNILAHFTNPEGFIKYSSVLEGNIADSKTLEGMINKLRIKTSGSAKKALVVIDAGIATEENLEMIKAKGSDFQYLTLIINH